MSPAVGDQLPFPREFPGQIGDERQQLAERDRERALDVPLGEALAVAHVEQEEVAPPGLAPRLASDVDLLLLGADLGGEETAVGLDVCGAEWHRFLLGAGAVSAPPRNR